MSTHKALARQWRPQSFKSFVGQEHAIKAIRQSLERQEIHHAHLLTGTRGVGKTTLARLFAKGLSCQTGITGSPCEQCDHCQGIEHGTFVDLIEIDAASRTKVEDTKELLSQVHYPPVHGRFKIYLIDEVHSLSGNSFNALLKTLEEPPSHIKFILATTDPQKLPITIHSRCLQLHLQNHHNDHIQGHLQDVLQTLNKSYDTEALAQIAACAAGSMRDALSLLEQAIALSGDHLTNETICAMLGRAEQKDIHGIIQAIAEKDQETIRAILTQLEHNASNYHNVIDQMTSALYELSQQKLLPTPGGNDWAPTQPAAQLQQYVQMLLQAKRDLDLYPDHTTGFNLTVMRMMAFTVDSTNIHQLLEKSTLQEVTTALPLPDNKPKLRSASSILKNNGTEPPTPTLNTQKKTLNQTEATASSRHAQPPSATSILKAQTKPQLNPAAQNAPSSYDHTAETPLHKPKADAWQSLLAHPACVGMLKQVLQQSTLQNDSLQDTWTILIAASFKSIINASFIKRLTDLCQQTLNRKITINYQFLTDTTAPQETAPAIPLPKKTPTTSTTAAVSMSTGTQTFASELNAEPISLTPPEFNDDA